MDIEKVVVGIITKHQDFTEPIELEKSLKEDYGLDSLDAVEICMEIEMFFDILIEDKELKTFVTAKDIVLLVDKKLADKAAKDER